jgi:hypothetical protein
MNIEIECVRPRHTAALQLRVVQGAFSRVLIHGPAIAPGFFVAGLNVVAA